MNKSEEMYKSLFNLCPLPQWVYEIETLRFVEVNEAAIRQYGYTKEEFLSMTIRDIRPPEDIRIVEEIIEAGVNSGFLNKSTVRHQKKTGEVIFVNVEGNSITFNGKKARLVLVSEITNGVDIAQYVENEKKIKESIERYNIVSKATSDAVYEWNFLTNEVIWNRGLKGIFGHKNADRTNAVWLHENRHPEDREAVASNVKAYIKARKPRWKGEYRFSCADGTYRYVLDRSFLIYDNIGHPVKMIGAIQDITERMHYIQAIEKQNLQLKEMAWYQSHVIRGPIARIIGLVDLLKSYPDDDDAVDLLEHVLTSAYELDDVVRSVVKRTEDFS